MNWPAGPAPHNAGGLDFWNWACKEMLVFVVTWHHDLPQEGMSQQNLVTDCCTFVILGPLLGVFLEVVVGCSGAVAGCSSRAMSGCIACIILVIPPECGDRVPQSGWVSDACIREE